MSSSSSLPAPQPKISLPALQPPVQPSLAPCLPLAPPCRTPLVHSLRLWKRSPSCFGKSPKTIHSVILQISITRNVIIGRLIDASVYNYNLSKIVKMFGQLEGTSVEFAHGRNLLNLETGIFCAPASEYDALFIVARHILHDSLSSMAITDELHGWDQRSSDQSSHSAQKSFSDYVTVTDRLLNPHKCVQSRPIIPAVVITSILPNVLVSIPLHSDQRSVFARLAAARLVHQLRRHERRTDGKKGQMPKIALSDKKKEAYIPVKIENCDVFDLFKAFDADGDENISRSEFDRTIVHGERVGRTSGPGTTQLLLDLICVDISQTATHYIHEWSDATVCTWDWRVRRNGGGRVCGQDGTQERLGQWGVGHRRWTGCWGARWTRDGEVHPARAGEMKEGVVRERAVNKSKASLG